ncbi:hypothetical protein Sinac_0500 [Singulisphaera acidiphila DSM 18658]|uniref:Uncharacterized protein n=1 Tax=Singulisphaera acidiphila (strain ATCC BAA-1392 / DSM 18658 / VKM B-2454 / MOB10) TaxID=886293 RepID=L0D7V6_SINAD|nr:hypothetical protein Sinac_0500 [Singulisphaera acidiphila DSM 18658]
MSGRLLLVRNIRARESGPSNKRAPVCFRSMESLDNPSGTAPIEPWAAREHLPTSGSLNEPMSDGMEMQRSTIMTPKGFLQGREGTKTMPWSPLVRSRTSVSSFPGRFPE